MCTYIYKPLLCVWPISAAQSRCHVIHTILIMTGPNDLHHKCKYLHPPPNKGYWCFNISVPIQSLWLQCTLITQHFGACFLGNQSLAKYCACAEALPISCHTKWQRYHGLWNWCWVAMRSPGSNTIFSSEWVTFFPRFFILNLGLSKCFASNMH